MTSHEILEEYVKERLLERGFSKDKLLNNRGLIGATIEDVVEYFYTRKHK